MEQERHLFGRKPVHLRVQERRRRHGPVPLWHQKQGRRLPQHEQLIESVALDAIADGGVGEHLECGQYCGE